MRIINEYTTLTRPADTTAYASGDLVANSTTAGSVIPLTISLGVQPHTQCFIRRVSILTSSTSITNAAFRVHFFKTSSITPANGDNGAFSVSNAANYIGSVNVTVDQAFTDGAFGVGAPTVGSEINFISSSEYIYALLEARGSYTPTSEGTFVVRLEAHSY